MASFNGFQCPGCFKGGAACKCSAIPQKNEQGSPQSDWCPGCGRARKPENFCICLRIPPVPAAGSILACSKCGKGLTTGDRCVCGCADMMVVPASRTVELPLGILFSGLGVEDVHTARLLPAAAEKTCWLCHLKVRPGEQCGWVACPRMPAADGCSSKPAGAGEGAPDNTVVAALEAIRRELYKLYALVAAQAGAAPPRGCVCPAGAEAGCKGALCPRRGAGGVR